MGEPVQQHLMQLKKYEELWRDEKLVFCSRNDAPTLYVLGVSIFTSFLDFGTAHTVWYVLFLILFQCFLLLLVCVFGFKKQ
jgi:hypothetical protein